MTDNRNDEDKNEKDDKEKGVNFKILKPKKPHPLFLWIIIGLFALLIYNIWLANKGKIEEISYSEMLQKVKNGELKRAIFNDMDISLWDAHNKQYTTYMVFRDTELVGLMTDNDMIVSSQRPSKFMGIFLSFLPFLIFIIFWLFMMRSMQGGGSNKAFSFGKSRAKLFLGGKTNTTFKDVAGVDEAKEELEEIVEFLKAPRKFQKLGGRIPRGVLLLGRPGTGKTLLAKAVAGEAGVPFYSISGSDFVEMFVGVGASRVRDLFEQAKRTSPCITFIDEIDAVGRHRGSGLGGGHDEREQTLNQLLVEMDGFEKNDAVIIIAATNRPDVLDPALLRPGRFDRQVVVDLPDIKGREEILQVHTRNLPVEKNLQLNLIARSTPGFSGADLENICNEAALLAARKGKNVIELEDFEEAKDKVIMGKERKSRVVESEEKRITAVHEIGHVLCSVFQDKTDPVHKVTIIPRGFSAGATHFLQNDKQNYSKTYLEQKLVELMGGRAAEETVFNEITTGAGNDIERVTDLAKKMVCNWGMSERLGPLMVKKESGNVFLGKEISQSEVHSEKTYELIDEEIRSIIQNARLKALEIIGNHREMMDCLADLLLEEETLDVDEIFAKIQPLATPEEQELLSKKYVQASAFKMEPTKKMDEAGLAPLPAETQKEEL